MTYAPIIAGTLIQAGALLIEAGLRRVVPEVAKLLEDQEINKVAENLKVREWATKTFTDVTLSKS